MSKDENKQKLKLETNTENPVYLDDGSVIYRQKPASSADIYLLYISAFAVMLAVLFIIKFFFPRTNVATLLIVFIVLNILLEVFIMQKVKNYSFSTLIFTDTYLYSISRPLVIFKRIKTIPWVEMEYFQLKENGELNISMKNGNLVKIDLQKMEDFNLEGLLNELNSRI